jgi:uncharacterized protein (DUF433 family)
VKNLLERISIDPKVCHGRPCIRGTRIMVWQIVSFLAAGDSIEDILGEYPQITREDVQACLAYAAETTKERVLPIEVTS